MAQNKVGRKKFVWMILERLPYGQGSKFSVSLNFSINIKLIALKSSKVPSLPMLASRPDLVPAVADALGLAL